MTTTYTEKEIRAEIQNLGLKYVILENAKGNKITSYKSGTKPETLLNQIFKTLNSKAIPDGLYFIQGKTGARSQAVLSFPYLKGEKDLSEPEIIRETITPELVQGMDTNKILEIISKNSALEVENRFLKADNDKLEGKIEALEEIIEELRSANSELSESEAELSRKGQLNLTELLPLGIAMLEGRKSEKESQENQELKAQIKAMNDNIVQLSKGFQMMAEKVQEHDDYFSEEEQEQEENEANGEMTEAEMLASMPPEIQQQYLAQKENLQ